MCQKKPHGLSQEVRELIMNKNIKRWKFVPRQGVEPCSLRTKRCTPARWGNLAQGRVLTSLSRAAATAVAECPACTKPGTG